MELNNNIVNTNVNDVSTLSSAININSLSNTQEIDSKQDGSFKIDSEINGSRSDLSNSLKDFSQQISSAQSIEHKLQIQQSTLNDIQSLMKNVIQSEEPEIAAHTAQPAVSELMNNYNSEANLMSSDLKEFQDATESSDYFDGRLGAKPISTSDILDAVDKQMAMINQHNKNNSEKLVQAEIKALDTIGKEVERAVANAPFEPIDFGKDIGNFSSANINTVVGSVATSQANAIPAHSPKLLA